MSVMQSAAKHLYRSMQLYAIAVKMLRCALHDSFCAWVRLLLLWLPLPPPQQPQLKSG